MPNARSIEQLFPPKLKRLVSRWEQRGMPLEVPRTINRLCQILKDTVINYPDIPQEKLIRRFIIAAFSEYERYNLSLFDDYVDEFGTVTQDDVELEIFSSIVECLETEFEDEHTPAFFLLQVFESLATAVITDNADPQTWFTTYFKGKCSFNYQGVEAITVSYDGRSLLKYLNCLYDSDDPSVDPVYTSKHANQVEIHIELVSHDPAQQTLLMLRGLKEMIKEAQQDPALVNAVFWGLSHLVGARLGPALQRFVARSGGYQPDEVKMVYGIDVNKLALGSKNSLTEPASMAIQAALVNLTLSENYMRDFIQTGQLPLIGRVEFPVHSQQKEISPATTAEVVYNMNSSGSSSDG